MGMPVIKPSNCSRCQALTDLIEAMALQECAISHILNAEGEEIQKAVAMKDVCLEDLITLNDSVKEIVQVCTNFDRNLKETLDEFEDCLCKCRPYHHDPCHDPCRDRDRDRDCDYDDD